MRLDVKKYLFIGHHSALQDFFEKAQNIALVHFIDTSGMKAKEVPEDIQNITTAIKVLRELPTLKQEKPERFAETDRIVHTILELKHAIDKLEEERRTLRLEIARIDIFGQFSLKDVEYLEKEANRKIQFFFAKKGIKEEMKLPEELVYVNSEHGLDYFVAVNKEPTQYENLIEMKIDHELDQLKSRFKMIETEILEKESKLKTYEKYNSFLHYALQRKLNIFNLETAKSYSKEKIDGQLFAIEGWVPQHKLPELEKVMEDLDITISEIAIEPDETVPTYLENKGLPRVGEDLVHIYDTPANTDKDPSMWVLLSFALFFAMIINDGGYGLVFLAGALYFKFKNPNLRATGRRVWKLMMLLFSFCIVWGILSNSFFGITLGPESPARKVSFVNWLVEQKAEYHFDNKDDVYQEWVNKYPDLKGAQTPEQFLAGAVRKSDGGESYEMIDKFSDSILMELALLVGVIHICLSFLRYLGRNWAGAGWVIAIIGSYLYLPEFLKATSLVHYVFDLNPHTVAQEGSLLAIGGLILAIVLGIVQNKWYGLLEIPNIVQIFADILSYLRLYALGLAGGIISATINDIASSIFLVGGILLVLVGHTINMVLSIIGGVIHGLRLNFIEWYHYSFEGGGKLFDPLRKVE